MGDNISLLDHWIYRYRLMGCDTSTDNRSDCVRGSVSGLWGVGVLNTGWSV